MKFIVLALCLVAAVMSSPMEPAREKRGIYIGSHHPHHVVAHAPLAYAHAPVAYAPSYGYSNGGYSHAHIAVHQPIVHHAPVAVVHAPVAHSYAHVKVHRTKVYHQVPYVAHHHHHAVLLH